MDGGVFHVIAFRKERSAVQKSEQQVDVATSVLEAHPSRSCTGTSAQPSMSTRDNPVSIINQMWQRGREIA